VAEGSATSATGFSAPDWITLAHNSVTRAAPTVHGAATSVLLKTGLWRTMRPVIDHDLCNRCWWVCSTFCPDAAIRVDADGRPDIDYEHCKGCLICVSRCPPHAITAVPEHRAAETEGEPS
jgi:pyruvate ferredoxin oxidoreductase gamma subunit